MCGWKPPGSGYEADKRVKDNLSALLEEPGLADFSKIMPKVRRERESWAEHWANYRAQAAEEKLIPSAKPSKAPAMRSAWPTCPAK